MTSPETQLLSFYSPWDRWLVVVAMRECFKQPEVFGDIKDLIKKRQQIVARYGL